MRLNFKFLIMASWITAGILHISLFPSIANAQVSGIEKMIQPKKPHISKSGNIEVKENLNSSPYKKIDFTISEAGFIGIAEGKTVRFFQERNGDRFQVPVDDKFRGLHIARNGNTVVAQRHERPSRHNTSIRIYTCRDKKGNILDTGEFEGEELLISPDGQYLLVARPNEFSGGGRLKAKRIGETEWRDLEMPEGATYFRASYLDDNSILAIIAKSDLPQYVVKFNPENYSIIGQAPIKTVDGKAIGISELSNSLVCSPDKRRISFLGRIPEYTSSPGYKGFANNTIVIIDDGLKISSITETDIEFSSIKFAGEDEVAVTSWSVAYLGTPNVDKWNPDNQVRVYDIATGKMKASGRGIGRHLQYVNYQEPNNLTLLLDNGMAFTYKKYAEKITELENETVFLGISGKSKIGFSRKARKITEVE